jgi:hypothetical protein
VRESENSMRKCPQCGVENPNDASSCSGCGLSRDGAREQLRGSETHAGDQRKPNASGHEHEGQQEAGSGDDSRGIRWAALILSFIGATFVGPALGAGIARLVAAALSIALGRVFVDDTVPTTLAIADSRVFFLVAWRAFYRLSRGLHS